MVSYIRGVTKTPFKQPFMLSRNSTSFMINNMSSIYTYQKYYSAPTHFLANTSFLQTLYKPKCFDRLIKVYVPTPRCLLQSIEGSLEFAYLLASLGLTKNLLVVSHTTFPHGNWQGNFVLTSIFLIS